MWKVYVIFVKIAGRFSLNVGDFLFCGGNHHQYKCHYVIRVCIAAACGKIMCALCARMILFHEFNENWELMLMVHCAVRSVWYCEIDRVMKCQHFHHPCFDVAFFSFTSSSSASIFQLFFTATITQLQMHISLNGTRFVFIFNEKEL